jgi:hypothetical protein
MTMRSTTRWTTRRLLFLLTLCVVISRVAHAQPTSRVIPFARVQTTLPPGAQPVQLQVWDAATGGTMVLTEAQNLDVDAGGTISFFLGSTTVAGLDPLNFTSGSSRYLDVVDALMVSVLSPPGRLVLSAVPFALSPGPAGPKGDKGDPGAAGSVTSVTGGDASIVIGGTPTDPAVSVAANGINDAKVANGALSPAKITGTAATLGPNFFVGNQSVSGTLSANNLSATSLSADSGAFTKWGVSGVNDFVIGGTGVYGRANVGNGLFGEGGVGVFGNSDGGYGVQGVTTAAHTFTNPGVYGLSTGVGGIGVIGEANLGNGWGVYGKAAGGAGVVGESTTGLAGLFIGKVQVKTLQIIGGADLSERFEVSARPTSMAETPQARIDPGMVVSIDPKGQGRLTLSRMAYDSRAAGVISGAGGITTGMLMGQSGSPADGDYPVALAGRVYCWADASSGPIEPGDLLTTSDTPGHAMKVTNQRKAQRAIIGKALTGLRTGKGLVLILVTLR